ncbi:right-handed parallel beta-helix repeat-containing protein [Methylibium sp.]|uniref:right-handed parallel beta-helix repeat-containing protein n=1 Tax=Methylibium sp. TaxID=2067992 RepID=UPI003BAB1722
MTRTRILLALWLTAFLHPAHAQTATVSGEAVDSTPDCYRGTAIFLPDAASYQACVDAAAADALTRKASSNYSARTNSTFTVTYTPPLPPPDVRTWVRIGPEKTSGGVIQSYTLAAPALVRFGVGQKWVEKALPAGRFQCSTSTFGDPAPGLVKACDREEVGPVPPVDPPVVVPPVEPPVVVPPTTGGVPARGEFSAYPSIGPITLQSNAVLRHVRVSGPGNCVSIAPGATNVLIEEVEIGPCGDTSDNSLGVRIGTGARDITIRRTDTHHVSGCLYSDAGVNPVVYDRNRCTSIRGPNDRRQASRGQMVQLNGVRGGAKGSKITCNVSDQTGTDHAVEDHINLYNSAGLPNDRTEVAYNRLRGGHPTSNSGSGIMTGDGSLGGHIWAHHNTIVNVRNVGIGVAGGVDVLVENNRIFMRMPEAQFVNQGIYVWSQGGGTCSGHTVRNNRVNTSSGSFWNGGNCGPVELAGNVYGDTSLTAAIFDEVPAECR